MKTNKQKTVLALTCITLLPAWFVDRTRILNCYVSDSVM